MRADEDLITPLLPALQLYQLAIAAPPAPRGSYDRDAAAKRGEELFNGKAKCAAVTCRRCTPSPAGTCTPARRSASMSSRRVARPTSDYRTAPLRGLWTHGTGGFYHDGRFPTLGAVIDHYDSHFSLGLTGGEKTRPRAST